MKPRIVITSPDLPAIALETVDASHLESLRRWKNAFRHRFFFQEEISPERQLAWYRGYLARPDDWLFVIRENGEIVGCIGYRLADGAIDIYNVLRDPDLGRHSKAHVPAVDLLCNYMARTHGVPIRGEVLADNPINTWGIARGFRKIGESVKHGLAYNIIEQDPAGRIPCSVRVQRDDGVPIAAEAALTAER